MFASSFVKPIYVLCLRGWKNPLCLLRVGKAPTMFMATICKDYFSKAMSQQTTCRRRFARDADFEVSEFGGTLPGNIFHTILLLFT